MNDLRSSPPPPPDEDDHVRGNRARKPIILYADFTCPRCALAHAKLAAAGAHVVFRHMALRAKHERAVALACAAEAAAAQGAFWAFCDALYADQGRTDDPHLWERARALGLDLARLDVDRRGDEARARVKRQTREAIAAGATTTPTLFVDEQPHSGTPDSEFLRLLGYHDEVRISKAS